MIEIFFFVNLLNDEFFMFKNEVENIIAKQTKQVELRILPTANLAMMDQYFTKKGILRSQLDRRNELFQIGFDATLDFEALTMIAGHSVATQYVQELQSVLKNTGHFTSEDRKNILTKLNIDQERLERRRNGDIIRDKIQHNQHLARQMGVNQLPTLVIFNFSREEDYAIRIEQLDDLMTLQDHLFSSDSVQEAVIHNERVSRFY